MKFTIYSLFLCFFFFVAERTLAQDTIKHINLWKFSARHPDANLDSIKKETENILRIFPNLDTSEGSGYNEYIRWTMFWENRAQYPDLRKGNYLSNYFIAQDQWDSICYANGDTLENKTLSSEVWEQMGPFGVPGTGSVHQNNGLVSALWVDPADENNIWIGSNTAGLWKTTDGGLNWENVEIFTQYYHGLKLITGVQYIAANPQNTDEMYISTGKSGYPEIYYSAGVFQSLDGGSTWQCIFSTDITQTHRGGKIIVNPSNGNQIIILFDDKVYKSNDKGATWTLVFGDPNSLNKLDHGTSYKRKKLMDVEFLPNDYNKFLISSDGYDYIDENDNVVHCSAELFYSDDFQNSQPSWSKIDNNWSYFTERIAIDVSASDNNNFYFIAADNTTLRFYTFSTISETIDNYYYRSNFFGFASSKMEYEISETDPTIQYLGGNYLHKLDWDANYSLNYFDMHVDVRTLCLYNSTIGGGSEDDIIYLGNDGGISRIEDESPMNINGEGLCITQLYGITDSENESGLVLCGAQDNGVFLFRNDDETNVDGSRDAYDGVISPFDVQRMMVRQNSSLSGGAHITRTLGAFSTQNTEYNPTLAGDVLYLDAPIYSSIINPNTVYSCYHDVLKTTNWGTDEDDWTNISNFNSAGVPDDARIQAFDIFDGNENIMWVGFGGATWEAGVYKKIMRSADGGTSWTDITANVPGYPFGGLGITDIEINPACSTTVYFCMGGCVNPSGQQRVYKTTNNGSNWTDMSAGLPMMPVNDLAVLEGYSGSEVLFAATDAGVYWKNGTADWERYGTELPRGIVDNIEINYLDNVIYAGTYGWGLWKCPLPCFNETTPLEITSNTTYSTYSRMDRPIAIKNGATLTISNTLTMPENAKIIIERGAKLIVDGGTIKSGCANKMWGGIDVWGTSSASQLTSGVQGKVELKNGAVIEDALDAINTIKKNTDGSSDWNYTGGIVTVKNAIIRNSNNGIGIVAYHNFNPSNPSVTIPNVSKIEQCVFETTKPLYDNDGLPYAFISLYEVEGIAINGCTFRNTRTDLTLASEKGTGILAYDASFLINDFCLSTVSPCTNYLNSSFSNLDYGIKQINTNTFHPAAVNSAVFEDNQNATYFSGATGTTLTLNSFDVSSDYAYGIYLDQCNAWQCEENILTGTTSVNTFGIVVNNSGSVTNQIYNNTLSNLKFGIETLDNNRGTSTVGLKIKCNDFSNCSKDILVTQYAGCSPCGICRFQGSYNSVTAPAGNTFSHTGPANQYTDIDNTFSSYPIVYYRHTGTSGAWIPLYFRNLSQYITSYSYTKATACPSNLGGSGGSSSTGSKTLELASIESRIDSLQLILSDLTDGGNTNMLVNEVSNSSPNDALILRADLLQKSPYLSDTVLAEVSRNEDVLNPYMLRDVLNANVHGIKSIKVQESLINRSQPLPINLLNSILAGLNDVSAKEILESELSRAIDDRKQLINTQLRMWMNDSTGEGIEPLQMFSQICNDWDVKAILLFQDSSAMLSEIPNNIIYNAVSSMQWNIKNSNRTYFDLTTDEINSLLNYTPDHDGFADMYALNMLRIAGDSNYKEPLVLYSDQTDNRYPYSSPVTESDDGFQVFPNPAQNFVTIVLNKPLENTAVYELSDVRGEVLKSGVISSDCTEAYIDLKGIPVGIYFLNFKLKDSVINVIKLVVE